MNEAIIALLEDFNSDAILAQIFIAIQERIATEVPEIKFIDQDLGQLEYYKDRPAVAFPCVLLDMADIQPTDNSGNSQIVTVTLEVRLAIAAYVEATRYFSRQHKETALNYYNVEHRINKALHGWYIDGLFNALDRVRIKTERREDNLRVRVISYQFAYMDNTAMRVPFQTIATPDLEIETI